MAVANYNSGGAWRQAQDGRQMDDVVAELEERISTLEAFLSWDEELRKQNPALQDLFEKFQVTKQLTLK